jgi:hypothetical protein
LWILVSHELRIPFLADPVKANSFIHMQTLQVLNLAENYLED